MQELSKIRRSIQKLLPQAPHETLLVLDATIGQNAIDQAQIFHQFTPITGIILTKLDGTAKGGIAAAVHKKLNIPILWTGLGEGAEDLVPFNPQEYVEMLLKTD
jgi:fused signal recognition particle receptor